MSTSLVTGGAGFIGWHLAEDLSQNANRVIVLDNLSRKLPHGEALNGIEIVKGDVTDAKLVRKLIARSDMVFHLAAISRVSSCIRDPGACFRVNGLGTEIIARSCVDLRRRLIFSSSREVYGTAPHLPVRENCPLNLENPYGASKIACEKTIEAYGKCYGLSYYNLRLANVYGKRDVGRVIPKLSQACLKNKDMILYNADKILDFVHVRDVTRALVKAAKSRENGVANIGSGTGITLRKLAQLMKDYAGSKSEVLSLRGRRGEVERFVADISCARTKLNWEPEVKLEDGIKCLLKGF